MVKDVSAKKYYAIDVVKFFASLFIVMIHVSLFSDVSAVSNYVAVELIARLAVPFFFAASGYFFFTSLKTDENGKILKEKDNFKVLKKYFVRIFVLYVVWSVIYMLWAVPMDYGTDLVSASVDYIITSVIKCSYYHLWYIYALVFAYPVVYLLLKKGVKAAACIASVLYLLKLLLSAYSFVPGITEINDFLGAYPLTVLENVFLRAVPLMLIGVMSAHYSECISKRKNLILLVVSFVCLIAESAVLYFVAGTGVAYLFFTVPTVFFFFNLIKQLDLKMNPTVSLYLRNMSTLIYCLHALFINICDKFIPQIGSTVIRCIIVILVSVSVSFVIVLFSRKYKIKLLKYLY